MTADDRGLADLTERLYAVHSWDPYTAQSEARTILGGSGRFLPDGSEVVSLLEALDQLRAAAREVWASVPATYDYDDPLVQRHAKALNALGAIVEEYAPFAGTERRQAER